MATAAADVTHRYARAHTHFLFTPLPDPGPVSGPEARIICDRDRVGKIGGPIGSGARKSPRGWAPYGASRALIRAIRIGLSSLSLNRRTFVHFGSAVRSRLKSHGDLFGRIGDVENIIGLGRVASRRLLVRLSSAFANIDGWKHAVGIVRSFDHRVGGIYSRDKFFERRVIPHFAHFDRERNRSPFLSRPTKTGTKGRSHVGAITGISRLLLARRTR